MPTLRTKSVGTKVTNAQYAMLKAVAGDQKLADWVREAVISAATAQRDKAVEPLILAEVMALRTIVLNLQYCVCAGEPITRETIQQLIDRADRDKVARAQTRLATAAAGD